MWKPNPGRLPVDCVDLDEDGNETGRVIRVHVRLFNGYCTKGVEASGWPASGRFACDWRVSGPPHSFEIEEYQVI